MSNSVLLIIRDADVCERLGAIAHSTNPRAIITIKDMEYWYAKEGEA
jgi:hypothetical protein